MTQFIIENKKIAKMKEEELEIVLSEEGKELWIKEKKGDIQDAEYVGNFKSREEACYIAREIQAETGIETNINGYFPNKEVKERFVFKNDTQEKMEIGEYFVSFDKLPSNILFRNFKSKEETENIVKEKGIISLYNDWLDWIGSDTIATEVGKYYIGKVVGENKNMYLVQYEEKQEEPHKKRCAAYIEGLQTEVSEHLKEFGLKQAWVSKMNKDILVIEEVNGEIKETPFVKLFES